MFNIDFLRPYINDIYLNAEYIAVIQESIKAKPLGKYIVLDNFLKTDFLDKVIEEHHKLNFDFELHTSGNGEILPYYGSVANCDANSILGLFLNSEEWHKYALNLFNLEPIVKRKSEIELRHHTQDSGGFWMHTDQGGGGAGPRDLVITLYYNKDWKVENGGMLQFWRMCEVDDPNTPSYGASSKEGPLDFYNQPRIRSVAAGEHEYGSELKDFVLIDQVLPVYNRIFLLNATAGNDFHSVSPSHGKIREGFVQRLIQAIDED
jgi:hypothetical protein